MGGLLMLTERKIGLEYFYLALYCFAVFALEILLVTVEQFIYGNTLSQLDLWQHLMHWTITCIAWGSCSWLLFQSAKKKLAFNIKTYEQKPCVTDILITVILLILYGVFMTYSWDLNFKPFAEFANKVKHFGSNAWIAFVFQNIYYIFESLLIYLLIAFGQEFGEKFWKSSKIPWGGILLGLSWGLMHIFTKNIIVGLLSVLSGVAFGLVYIVMHKNPKYAFPFIVVMFII